MVRIFVASRRPCDADAFATSSYETYFVFQPWSAETLVRAAVNVVFPWSTWPIVPTFTCGLVRSNFAFAIVVFLWFSSAALPDLLSLHLADDLFCLALRNFLVMRKLHRVYRAPLRHRAQLRGVAEHFGERHRRSDDLRLAALCHASDLAAPRREIAEHVAHVCVRHDDFDVHQRLQQHRMRALGRFLHRHRTGDLERDLARVHVVIRTVHQLDLDI